MLNANELHELHERAVNAGLASSEVRHLLLGGLPKTLVAKIPVTSIPADQLRYDLETLADAPLQEGIIPLLVWLTNARNRLRGRPEAAFFGSTLRRLDPPKHTRPMGVAPLNPIRLEPSASALLNRHPHGDLLERCLLGLEWPLRARAWRSNPESSVQLAIVSVLARHIGQRAVLDTMTDARFAVVLAQSRGASVAGGSGPTDTYVFDDPGAVREHVRDYFGGRNQT